jgi:hypothetical protein
MKSKYAHRKSTQIANIHKNGLQEQMVYSPPQPMLCKVPWARRKSLGLDCGYWPEADPWHQRDRKESRPSVQECGRNKPLGTDQIREELK